MPRPIALVFAFIALPTCLMFAVLVPPGQVADEPAHIARADALRHGVLHGQRRETKDADGHTLRQAGVRVDAHLLEVAFVLRPGRGEQLDVPRFAAHLALPWSEQRPFAEIGTVASYLPLFYLPGAAGLAGAEAVGIGPYAAVIFWRVLAALCFVTMGVAALALTQRGHNVLFCTLCLPMTLSLAASFNQDGLLIGAGTLAAALATRADRRSWHGTAVLVGCIAAVKLPYAPMLALLFVRRSVPVSHRFGIAALAAVPALVWTAFMLVTVSAPTARLPYPAGLLWPGDPGQMFTSTDPVAQLEVLAAAPMRLITLPFGTIVHDRWLLVQGIGVLGWLDVLLPAAMYGAWTVALASSLIADASSRNPLLERWWHGPLLAVACIATIWGVYLSQYLLWTDVGLDHVEGPTGRYFLPLLPTIGIALPCVRWRVWHFFRVAATGISVLVASSGLIVLPAVVVRAYYLR